jgi:hypothetical protein
MNMQEEIGIASSYTSRIPLQPASGSWVVFPCADVVEAGQWNVFIPIRAVPSERVRDCLFVLNQVPPCIVGIAVLDVPLAIQKQAGVP